MYLPEHFKETRIEILHALMREHPLATLVTLSSEGITANHIPLLLNESGSLEGHVARTNPIWQDLVLQNVLVIFQGPATYISPTWYPSKKENGKVVPTWNYAVVHAHGQLRIIDDAGWLKQHLIKLTNAHESHLPSPWQLPDAPEAFTAKLISAVVGIELTITKLEGKWKASQNQSMQNRSGVIAGLRELSTENSVQMANLVEKVNQSEL